MTLHGGNPRSESGTVTAGDMVDAMRRVAASIAAAPLIAAKVEADSRVSAYEIAEMVREMQDRLFSG